MSHVSKSGAHNPSPRMWRQPSNLQSLPNLPPLALSAVFPSIRYRTHRQQLESDIDKECDDYSVYDERAPILRHTRSIKSPLLSQSALCSSHIIDTPLDPPPAPLLFDDIPPLRALVWQYMDNRSAVHYLSTCQHQYALYHSFPLTEPVSSKQLKSICSRTASFRHWWYQWLWLTWTVPISLSALLVFRLSTTDSLRVVAGITECVVVAATCAFYNPNPAPHCTHCCSEPTPSRFWRAVAVPRIVAFSGWCSVFDVARYLQHAVEAHVYDHECFSLTECKLPATLRRLSLKLHSYRQLTADTLPSQLVLAMEEVDEVVLQPGVLPQSLVALVLLYQHSVRESTDRATAMQPIAAGVLPSQLQRLVIEWSRSLADLALPPSLTRLDLHRLPDATFPPDALPATLHTLLITAARPTSIHTTCTVHCLPAFECCDCIACCGCTELSIAGAGAAPGGAGPGWPLRAYRIPAACRLTHSSHSASRAASACMVSPFDGSRRAACITAAEDSGGWLQGGSRGAGTANSAACGIGCAV